MADLTAAEQAIADAAVMWAKKSRKDFAVSLAPVERFPGEKEPVAAFMAGSPGAGKTEASKALAGELGGFLRIDPDEFRKSIPPGGHFKLLHLWPGKFLQAGRFRL